MADEAPLGPQPDFNLIATEIRKIANIPAIAGGQQILIELREMRGEMTAIKGEMTAMKGEMRAMRGEIRQDIVNVREDLMTMMTASNRNNTARVQNTYVGSRTANLSAFVNPSNGAAIPNFPTTSMEIDQMTRRQLDGVLQQLGLEPAQGEDSPAKKRMLRAHIGLREVAAQAPP